MAKQSGLGDNLYVAGVNVSGDISALGRVGGGPAALESTGIDKYGYERLGGLRDGAIEFTSFFNPAVGAAHPTFGALPRTDVGVIYCRGTTLGNPGAACVAKQANYDGSRGNDGSFTFSVSALSNGYGIEWGKLLTAGQRTDTTATNGTGVDFGAAGSFGLQAHLQVFAFTGTSVTIKLQQSSDNGGGDAFSDVTGGGFTLVTTAPGTQRIETARGQAVERYLRVVTTGTFSNLVFAVVAAVNPVATVF